MTVTEYQATQIERIAQGLAHFVETTRRDRVDWKPTVGEECETRSALEQLGECVTVNRAFTQLLQGESFEGRSPRTMPAPKFSSVSDACQQLIDSARTLAEEIRRLGDDILTVTYPTWRGPMAGQKMIEMPYRNMAYHCGQVNLIQLLYGDNDFHVPPSWV
jgi:hypothetical protein